MQEQNSNGVTLVIPELKIPAGYIFKGDVLLGEIAIPQQDIIFKDVQIEAGALVDEIVKRVLAALTDIIKELPPAIDAYSKNEAIKAIQAYGRRR